MLYFCVLCLLLSYSSCESDRVLVKLNDGPQTVRLVQPSSADGLIRLEIDRDGSWETQCSCSFDELDAINSCFKLNYNWAGRTFNITGNELFENLKCVDIGKSTKQCSWGAHSCGLIRSFSATCNKQVTEPRISRRRRRRCRFWRCVTRCNRRRCVRRCGCNCFAAQSTVYSADGQTIKMSDLVPGDRVLTVNTNTGTTQYDKVLSFLHRQTNVSSEFLNIETKSGRQLLITPEHLIFASSKPTYDPQNDPPAARFAVDVRVGDYVFVANIQKDPKQGDRVIGDEVMKVSTVIRQDGVYAPLTSSGTIVVDGVMSSCYASFNSHDTAQLAMAPLRMIHYVSGWFGLDNIGQHLQNDGDVHWYAGALMKIAMYIMPGSF